MPYTGIVLSFVAIHAAVFLILLGHWVAAAGMFPKATRNFAGIYEERPLRALLVGIFTYGPVMLAFMLNARIANGPVRFLVFVAAFAALLMAMIGSAGLALRIGRNLCGGADTWQQALRGGVMLALVFITPLLGWFVGSLGLASGLGAVLLSLFSKTETEAQPVTVPPPVPAVASLS